MLKNKSQLISWAKFFLGWPLSILSIIFIIKLIYDKSSQISINLNDINWLYLIIGVLVLFAYYLLRSFLWLQELKERGENISFKENTYRFAFSELKRFAPGNIWSFLSRASQFHELGIDKKTIGISIISDIQLVIIGCGIVSIFSISWLLDSSSKMQTNLATLLPISILAIIIFFVATGFIYRRKYGREGPILGNFLMPGFRLESKIKLSALSFVTYFVFGVGNYFLFISIFDYGFNSFLSISSFFAFSLLIGYLSFITPMGLGVREGVVTLGLSKIMSLTNAGVVAIFSRIILIISELLFLLLVLLWKKFPSKK